MNVALYVLLCLIWGSTWIVIKIGYGGLGPFNVAAVRFLLAGLVLTPVVPIVGARWPAGRTEWALVLWVGVVLFAADYGLIYWGEQFLESGLTSILFATLPLITMGLAHVYIPASASRRANSAARFWPFLEWSPSSAIASVWTGRCGPHARHRREHRVRCRCRHCVQAFRLESSSGRAQCAGDARGRRGAVGALRDRG